MEEYVEYGLWSIDGELLGPTEIAYSRSLLKGEVIHNEQMLVGNKAEGTRIPLLQNSAPLRGEDGEITGAVIAFADITHMKELERQKDDFLSLVSHELRTPLTTIAGNAESLARHGVAFSKEDIEAAHRDIQAEAVRLQQVVENMLALSRVDSQRGAELEPVLLERVVAGAVSDHQRRFPNREMTLDAGGEDCVVDGMPSFVLQVTSNLLSNAEKYGPSSGAIDVTVCREGDMAVTRVFDRGDGVASGETELVFEAFFRANASARRAAGLGLGLAVCKRLIDAQGGHIWYLPREGGGSEFGFSLQLCPE